MCGVRQGENLSPVLFSIYLNDLEEYLNSNNAGIELKRKHGSIDVYLKIFVLLYADDTVIVSEDEKTFQNMLNDFHQYCKQWKLTINMQKTKIIIFGTSRPGNYMFTLSGEKIEIVKEYKYLGVLFSSSGSFLKARKQLIIQAKKALHILYMRIANIDLPIDVQIKLFDQTIVPILTYNCEVWGFENLDLIERVHTDFLRKITNSKKSTPLYMLYGELGRYPLEIVIKTRIINYWCKLLMGSESKISRQCYEFMLNSEINYKWLNYVKNILDFTGNTNYWINQKIFTLKNVGKLIKRTLLDQFIQKFNENLANSSKGTNYRLFKSDIKFEPYLNILPPNKRLTVFHFRTGNHRLPVETGRWRNCTLPYEDRKCMLCSLNDVGDEFHYLLKCPFFTDERMKYIPRRFYNRTNVIKFRELMSAESLVVLNNLSTFLHLIIIFFRNTCP
jgi:hypothetical protein